MCEARAVIHLFKISLCEGFPAGTRLRLDVRVCWAHTACDLDIGDQLLAFIVLTIVPKHDNILYYRPWSLANWETYL